MQPPPARTEPLALRITPGEKAAIEQAAAANGRSVSAQVRVMLRDWLTKHGYLKGQDK